MEVLIVFGFITAIVVIITKSNIGQAIAEAIRHNSGASQIGVPTHEIDELRGEIEQLRAELDGIHHLLGENVERLDFAERMLTARHEVSNSNGVQQ